MPHSAHSSRRGRRTLNIELLEDRQLLAVDLEPLAINSIGLPSQPEQLAVVDEQVYFVATHGRTQAGLWVTDGTDEGTRQVLPDKALPTFPRFRSLTGMGGKLYYALDERTLWGTDGTEEGTESLATFRRIGGFTHRTDFISAGDAIYLVAEGEESAGQQLWRSDGTSAGTVIAAEIPFNGATAELGYLTNVAGMVYFASRDPGGRYSLWRLPAASDGAELVQDLAPGEIPGHFTAVGNVLFYSVTDQSGEGALWRADGSKRGAELVGHVRLQPPVEQGPFYERRTNTPIAAVGDLLYFAATDGDTGFELWRSDGTEEGTVLVKDIAAGADSSEPIWLTNVSGTLYFTADDGVDGRKLWKSDGTQDGTLPIDQTWPGDEWKSPRYLQNANGTLFFVASEDATGLELWSSDGTSEGTALVRDIRGGELNGVRGGLVNVGDVVYFAGNDGPHGDELWRSNGTEEGTTIVKDIVPGLAGTDTVGMANVSGTIFFGANDGIHGHELWATDGTEEGTRLVKDIHPAPEIGSVPQQFTNVSDTLYFSAQDVDGVALWRSDGTEEGTVPVKRFTENDIGEPTNFTNLNGTLYFSLRQPGASHQLWRSDGTEEGTVKVADHFDPESSIAIVDDTVFFAAYFSDHGWELAKVDPESTEAVLVKDIAPGTDWSRPRELINVQGTLYFVARDGEHGVELWRSDGTEAGTQMVRDIVPDLFSSDPQRLTNVNGTLYFVAQEPNTDGQPREQIWKSDGTEAGTDLAIIVNDDPTVARWVRGMVNVDGVLYFTTVHVRSDVDAFDLTIWRANKVGKQAVPIKSFSAETSMVGPSIFQNIAGLLYFNARDDSSAMRLWRSDGSEVGTELVDQVGRIPTTPVAVVPLRHQLFVSALNDTVRPSLEMWVGNAGWQNLGLRGDVNGDGIISPHDALLIINELTFSQYRDPETGAIPVDLADPIAPHLRTPLFDVNGDGFISPHDALLVINQLGLPDIEDKDEG